MHIAAVTESLQSVPVISLGSEDVPRVGIAVCEAGSRRGQTRGDGGVNCGWTHFRIAVSVRGDALCINRAGHIIRAFCLSGFGHASVEPVDAIEAQHGINDSL